MPSNKPKFTLRVDKKTLDKLRYIADNNFRTINKELEMLIKMHIDSFEKRHGSIKNYEEKTIFLGNKGAIVDIKRKKKE